MLKSLKLIKSIIMKNDLLLKSCILILSFFDTPRRNKQKSQSVTWKRSPLHHTVCSCANSFFKRNFSIVWNRNQTDSLDFETRCKTCLMYRFSWTIEIIFALWSNEIWTIASCVTVMNFSKKNYEYFKISADQNTFFNFVRYT